MQFPSRPLFFLRKYKNERHTHKLGNLTQSKIVCKLVSLGYNVFLPFGDGGPVDLIWQDNECKLIRVQCKTGRVKQESIIFNCYSVSRNSVRKDYTGLIDVFVVYVPSLDRILIVPIEETNKSTKSIKTNEFKYDI